MSQSGTPEKNPKLHSRRSTLAAAAWSAPAIAAVAAAPLASASGPLDAVVSASNGGQNMQIDATKGTVSGTFAGALNLTNVSGTWNTGELDGRLRLAGPWSTSTLTKPNGDPFTLWEVIVVGEVSWILYNIKEDADGVYGVFFYAVSRLISTNVSFPLPSARYSGTFIPGTPTGHNRVDAQVEVAAQYVNGGNAVTTSSPNPFPPAL
jgi:hypothetical protein